MGLIVLLAYIILVVIFFAILGMLARYLIGKWGVGEPWPTIIMLMLVMFAIVMLIGIFTGHVSAPGIRWDQPL